jgi:hypothetical protein
MKAWIGDPKAFYTDQIHPFWRSEAGLVSLLLRYE